MRRFYDLAGNLTRTVDTVEVNVPDTFFEAWQANMPSLADIMAAGAQ